MVSGFRKDSKNQSGAKKKGKLVFAKDKNQATLAIVVVCLFVANSIYMIAKNVMGQRPQKVHSTEARMPEELIAQQQENNLQQLASEPINSPAQNMAQDTNDIYTQTLNLQNDSSNTPKIDPALAKNKASEDDVDVMTKKPSSKQNGKMVMISVSDTGRSNPFLPAVENIPAAFAASGIPYLLPPPETLPSNSDAGKVMTTTISGILYDQYSPSAIINIEGTDYLVKKGDVINHYKVISIDKNQVLVQLGKNVYKAGVGELLSQANINYNTVANLNKKFGGNDISINVKKKGY